MRFDEAKRSLLGRLHPVATDRIDIARQAGGHNRVLKRSYEVRLDAPGTVNVTRCVSRALKNVGITVALARLTQPWRVHEKSGPSLRMDQ
jgi:hypothetical protein